MNNNWKTIVSKDWADCVLHNLPFNFVDQEVISLAISNVKIKPVTVIRSFYDLSKSAKDWNYSDFTV